MNLYSCMVNNKAEYKIEAIDVDDARDKLFDMIRFGNHTDIDIELLEGDIDVHIELG